MPLIYDPMTTPAIRPAQCLPGVEVLHRQSQHRATVVCLEEPYVWLQYADDRSRGLVQSIRVPREHVILPRYRTP
jgi:hypothetical protein